MTKKIILINIFLFLFVCSAAQGADWMYLIENERGDKQYIDVESIKKVSTQTFHVMRKIEYHDSSELSAVDSYLELDCEGSRMKLLNETAYDKKGTSRTATGNHQFKNIGPDDIEETLLELVCSLKKTR